LDAAVRALALPIPVDIKDASGRPSVLPGAPLAFVNGTPDGYMDSNTLAKWCREKGNFLPSAVDELEEYFSSGGDGKDARSFVSVPLLDDDGPFAVLNIHANRPDLLGPEPARRLNFLQMVESLIHDLRTLLLLEGAAPKMTKRGGK